MKEIEEIYYCDYCGNQIEDYNRIVIKDVKTIEEKHLHTECLRKIDKTLKFIGTNIEYYYEIIDN